MYSLPMRSCRATTSSTYVVTRIRSALGSLGT